MLSGVFIFANGLEVSNNITKAGASAILAAAFQGVELDLWVGLCDAVPDADLVLEDLTEPAIGTNGYARQSLPIGLQYWPTLDEIAGAQYVESEWITWQPNGGSFSQPIRRMFLTDSEDAVEGDVFCLSAALPQAITIGLDTAEADRKFKYRVYLR